MQTLLLLGWTRATATAPGCSAAAMVALFIATGLYALLGTSFNVGVYDEGVIISGAMQVLDGKVLHRDFYANYGPGQFYALAALYKMFGVSIISGRVWGALIKASILCVCYAIGRKFMPPLWSFAAAAGGLIWLCFADNAVWPAWSALLACLYAVYFMVPVIDGTSLLMTRLLAAGVCIGVATLFRYDVGFIGCVAVGGVAALHAWVGAPRVALRSAAIGLLIFGAGVAAVCLPVLAAAAYAHALHDFLFDVVQFPSHNYAATRGLPFPAPLRGRRPFSDVEYMVYFPFLAVIAASVVGLWARSGELALRQFQARRWSYLLLAAITVGMFGKGLVRVSALHMTIAIVPGILLLTVVIYECSRSRLRAWVIPTLLGALWVTGANLTLQAFDAVSARVAAGIAGTDGGAASVPGWHGCHPQPGAERITCFRLPPDQLAAVGYIQAHSKNSDTIFSALPQHQRVFANNVAFYFAAARRPATKWYHFDPGLQSSAAIQSLIVADLQKSSPVFIVIDAQWEGWREPNASALSSGVRLLDEFIAAHFEPAAVFGGITILKPRFISVPVGN